MVVLYQWADMSPKGGSLGKNQNKNVVGFLFNKKDLFWHNGQLSPNRGDLLFFKLMTPPPPLKHIVLIVLDQGAATYQKKNHMGFLKLNLS